MTFKYSEYQKSLNSYIDYSAYPKFNRIGIINSGNDYYSNSYYTGLVKTMAALIMVSLNSQELVIASYSNFQLGSKLAVED